MVTHQVWWAGIASRAHIIYGASWLRSLRGDVRVTVFPFRSFLSAPTLTLNDVREIVPDTVRVTGWDERDAATRASHHALLNVGAVGIKPWLTVRRMIGRRPLHVVVTDEGFGSYGSWASRRKAWQRQGVPEPWRTLRTIAVEVATRTLTRQRWLLHEQPSGRRGGWRLNPQVAAEFRRHAQRHRDDGGAVFLSQPWPELGVLSEDRYLAHVAEVAEACAGAGLAFTVQPHPGEPPERYAHWNVHRGRGLAELDERTVNATVLLGATSTAMLNVAAIHRVPALRVGFPEMPALEDTHGPRQQSLLHRYLGEITPPGAWGAKLSELGAAKPKEQ